jgi:hypothetical protein
VASWVARLRELSRDDPRTFALGVGAALAGLALLISGWQAVTSVLALNDAKASAVSLTNAISSGDVQRAKAELEEFDDATTRAHHRTDGPLWWLGSHVPILGRNLDAVRTIAAQSDAIADEALPGIVRVADQVKADTFRPRNGRVDLEAVADLLPVLATTDRVMERADEEISRIRTEKLLGPLQAPAGDFAEQTHAAATAAAAAHDAGRLLPTMLARTGPTRHYLLMILNNAEVRSIGGMPGSFAVLEARRGRVEMREQGSNSAIERDLRLDVKPELRAGFSRNVGYDLRDVAIIPDFPRASSLAARLAESYWDVEFDGVIAVDPIALGYVLGAVGALDIGDGLTINQANAAQTLLNGIYLKYPDLATQAKAQDAAFENAARRIFNALTAGRGDSVRALRALVRGVQEDRILLWSAHRSEQARIRSTGISGPMTDRQQPDRPQVGLYLTDMSQAKLDFYLHSEVRVEATRCYDDGVQDLVMTTTLTSDVPQGVALPTSVTGFGSRSPIGVIGLSVRVMAPPGGEIRSIKIDGKAAPVGSTEYRGRQLSRFTRFLEPGENSVIVTEFRSGRGMPGAPMLKATPSAHPNDERVVGLSACA